MSCGSRRSQGRPAQGLNATRCLESVEIDFEEGSSDDVSDHPSNRLWSTFCDVVRVVLIDCFPPLRDSARKRVQSRFAMFGVGDSLDLGNLVEPPVDGVERLVPIDLHPRPAGGIDPVGDIGDVHEPSALEGFVRAIAISVEREGSTMTIFANRVSDSMSRSKSVVWLSGLAEAAIRCRLSSAISRSPKPKTSSLGRATG